MEGETWEANVQRPHVSLQRRLAIDRHCVRACSRLALDVSWIHRDLSTYSRHSLFSRQKKQAVEALFLAMSISGPAYLLAACASTSLTRP